MVRDRDLFRTISTFYGGERAKEIKSSLDPQCLSGFRKNEKFEIEHSDVILTVDNGDFVFFDCAYEELLQSLGPINDTESVPWTMFNDNVSMGYFDVYDQYLLNLLYDPRIKPGMTVADIGAGEGYYTIRLAQRVGAKGRVLAEDIIPAVRDLPHLAERNLFLPITIPGLPTRGPIALQHRLRRGSQHRRGRLRRLRLTAAAAALWHRRRRGTSGTGHRAAPRPACGGQESPRSPGRVACHAHGQYRILWSLVAHRAAQRAHCRAIPAAALRAARSAAGRDAHRRRRDVAARLSLRPSTAHTHLAQKPGYQPKRWHKASVGVAWFIV